jgi:energy-coupling factor transporter ATP-binding protein EcfA2
MSVYECEELYGVDFYKFLDFEGNTYCMNKNLAVNLKMKVHWTKKYKGDCVFFIDGTEGSGKSTLARQIGKLLDPNFSEKNIIFDLDTLKARFYNGIDWEVLVYDESQEGVDRIKTLSSENANFNAFMRQSRQAHKILVLCGPSIYDISSYVAQHRVNFLIHCYKKDNIHPGHFMFFNESLIHDLFIHDKKERKYTRKANFIGTFPNADVCDMLLYNERKKQAFEKFRPAGGPIQEVLSKEQIIREWKVSRLKAWDSMKSRSKNLLVKDVCTVLDISRVLFHDWIKKYDLHITGTKVGIKPRDIVQEEISEDNDFVSDKDLNITETTEETT